MTDSRARWLAATLVLSLAVSAGAAEKPLALDARLPLTAYARESWSADDGLPLNSLRAVAQCENGYIWIATEEGLARFDGKNFRMFNATNTPAMKSSSVMEIAALRDGSVALSTWGGLVLLRKNGSSVHMSERDGLPTTEITSMVEGRDGALWIGTANGLVRLEKGKITARYGLEQGLPAEKVTALALGADDALWVATREGIVLLRGNRVQAPLASVKLPPMRRINALVADGARLWIGTRGAGLVLVEGTSVTKFDQTNGLGSDFVNALAKGSDGAIWAATLGGGLARLVDGKIARLVATDGLESDIITGVLEDQEGSIWLTTTGAGLHRLKMPKVKMISTRDGLSSDAAMSLLEDRAGNLWIGTAGMGLNRYRNGAVKTFVAKDGLPGIYIFALHEARDGAIWIATGAGVSRYAQGSFSTYTRSDHGVPGRVHAFHESRDGTFWAGGSKGLARFVDGKFVAEPLGIPEKSGVYAIEETSDGALWFATRGSGILRRSPEGTLTRLTKKDGLYSDEFLSLSLDHRGTLWASTMEHGVNRIQGDKISGITMANGLMSDRIFNIAEDDFGDIWMTSNRGISRLSRTMLDGFDRGAIAALTLTMFGKADGLKNQECNGGFDDGIRKGRDGKLYFPTMGGVAVIDPATRLANTTPPLVDLDQVLVDGAPREVLGRIDQIAGRNNFEFRYTALSFYAPEATRFRYRLEGFDEGWVEAGTRRSAYYTHLPPGDFRFVVEATNNDGVRSARAASIELKLRPRFYQTKTFLAITALLAAVLLAALVRLRIGRLKDRESLLLQILEERERAEVAVRGSERHFRTLIENGSDIIMVIDRNGTIAYASPSVSCLLGYRDAELQGTSLDDAVHHDDAAEALHVLTRKVKEGMTVATTFRFRHRDGSWRWLEAAGRCADAKGCERVIVNCRDISERMLLESQLQQANRLNSLGRLAATVAHEFNNVLMGIQPFAEILGRYSTHPRSQEAIEHIEGSVKRGRRVSEEILRYTRPSEPVLLPIALDEWLGEAATEIQLLVGKNVEVTLDLPSAPLAIDGDLQQLNQVLTNLALNARDAMPSGGNVAISVRACEEKDRFSFGALAHPETFIQLTVRDTGGGIPEDVLPHIFEPLFTTKKRGGTGLGLAVAHQVVQRHGGALFVESQVGVGTAFHMFLPKSRGAVPAERIAPAESPRSVAMLRRVLLVEDDCAVASGIAAVLEMEAILVMTVERGSEVADAIVLHKPDAIVLDVDLPDIDGAAVYERIAARWPEMPVVFSTGNGDESKLERFLLRGHVAFLRKPYESDQLMSALQVVVSGGWGGGGCGAVGREASVAESPS